MTTGRTTEDFQRATPGDEEGKSRIKANGLECLRRLHADQTWEDWRGTGAALMVITEEALAAVGARHWDKDNKNAVMEFNRRWEEYEAMAGADHKPLTKRERWALREVMTNPEIEVWRAQLDGPQKRRLNHPDSVINRWRADTRTRERNEVIRQRDERIARMTDEEREVFEAVRNAVPRPVVMQVNLRTDSASQLLTAVLDILNAAYHVDRWPPMEPRDRQALAEQFAQADKAVEELLGWLEYYEDVAETDDDSEAEEEPDAERSS